MAHQHIQKKKEPKIFLQMPLAFNANSQKNLSWRILLLMRFIVKLAAKCVEEYVHSMAELVVESMVELVESRVELVVESMVNLIQSLAESTVESMVELVEIHGGVFGGIHGETG